MDLYNILIVDDEVGNLNALERTFRSGYNVFSATDGENALVIMGRHEIAVIISDHRMPGMTGIEFLEKTLQKYPDTIRIVLTAYTDEQLLMDAINMGHVYGYVTKPWEPDELEAIVREGIDAYEITRASRELYTRTLLRSGVISLEQLDGALQVQRAEKKTVGEILVEHGVISEDQMDMAMKLQESERKQLGEALIELGAISPNDLEMARNLQKHERRRLAEILIDLGYADEEKILSCYALQLGMPYIPLSQFSGKPELAELLPSRLAYKHTTVPVEVVGRVLVLAASEPLSDKAKDEIERETEHKIMSICSSHADIESALEQYYPNWASPKDKLSYPSSAGIPSVAGDDTPMSNVPEIEWTSSPDSDSPPSAVVFVEDDFQVPQPGTDKLLRLRISSKLRAFVGGVRSRLSDDLKEQLDFYGEDDDSGAGAPARGLEDPSCISQILLENGPPTEFPYYSFAIDSSDFYVKVVVEGEKPFEELRRKLAEAPEHFIEAVEHLHDYKLSLKKRSREQHDQGAAEELISLNANGIGPDDVAFLLNKAKGSNDHTEAQSDHFLLEVYKKLPKGNPTVLSEGFDEIAAQIVEDLKAYYVFATKDVSG
jgi:CheY-like chemotaxis protein